MVKFLLNSLLIYLTILTLNELSATNASESLTEDYRQSIEGDENVCVDTASELRHYNGSGRVRQYPKCCTFYEQVGNKCLPRWYLVSIRKLVMIWIFLPILLSLFALFFLFCIICLCRQSRREVGNFYRESSPLSYNLAPRPPTSSPPSYNDAVPNATRGYNEIEKPNRIHNAQYLAAEAPTNVEMKMFKEPKKKPAKRVKEDYYESIDVAPREEIDEEKYNSIKKTK